MVKYIKEDNLYKFFNGGEELFSTDDPHMIVDVDSKNNNIILLKHGSKEIIQEIFKTYSKTQSVIGGSFFMVSLKSLDPEEITKILTNTGYFPESYKEFLFQAQDLESSQKS